ncbi:MAG TPA: TIGR04372 family glycosyltransferase [Candidatus Omnitrophota bacterium]|nr:TIGR04372 family glycosyltransferase [Candidatus Omnitrophota bacterium]
MRVKFIPISTMAIGHLAGELDCYIKEGILDLRPQYRAVLLALKKDVVNQYFLGYWRKRILIIQNPILCILLSPFCRSMLTRYRVEKYFCGHFENASFPEIQRKYYGRPPILSLTNFDRNRGWKVLRNLGLPSDAWFACVHCRENGFGMHKNKETLRNVDINNYLSAMQEIVDRGGWVIRVGDPTMKSIPKMRNVIDYAHLSVKSDWMDVFLCASCKFFLGSNSGLSNLASVFGVLTAAANISGPISAILPYGPDDIAIPKLIWSIKENRYLSFKEIFSTSIGNFRTDSLYKEHSIIAVENSSEDVKGLAIEALEKVNGLVNYSEEDHCLQERFKSLMNETHYSYGAVSRVGAKFLQKYQYLL